MSKYSDYRCITEATIPKVMRALVASGSGFENLAVQEVAVPDVGPDQLLARVDAAGVCTSIIKLIEQGENHPFINGWDMKKWPVILGDEGSVTLVKIGDNLRDKYKIGQRCAIQPAVNVAPILYRERYKNNAEGMHKCAVGYTLGGQLAQYIRIQEEVLEADCLLPLAEEGMGYFEVSMAEPVSCVYSAQQRNYHLVKDGPHDERKAHLGLLPGGITIIVGAGVMGRIHAELSLRYSPAVLIVTARTRPRLDLTMKTLWEKAKAKGTKLICVTADKLADTVKEFSKGQGADDIILAVGDSAAQQSALGLLAKGGVANFFGGLPRGDHVLELDTLAVHYDEIKVVGSSGGEPSDMAATLQAIADRQIDPGNYVAAVGSLDNAIDVLKMIKERRIDGKAILYPHIKKTQLQMVDYWDKDREQKFLDERLEDVK
jgi:threonine dehydrogenase-like Zn-dependent dehydrogenase